MADDDDLPSGYEPERERPSDRERPPERSSTPPPPDEDREKKRLLERVIPEIVKRVLERAVEQGATRVAEAPENLKNLVGEMKLPKEVLHYLYTQIDDTKNGLYRVVAKEIRDVLEQTQFADELAKVLTKLSFEIKTEIRFIPNDQAVKKGEDGGEKTTSGLPKPDVKAQVSVRDRSKEVRRDKREDT